MRKAAYQSLGPFITTFKVEDEGEDVEGKELSSLEPAEGRCEQKTEGDSEAAGEGEQRTAQQMRDECVRSYPSLPSNEEDPSLQSSETWIEKHLKVVSITDCVREQELDRGSCESPEFNDVLFWRQPIPDLDLNLLNNRSSHLCSSEEVEKREVTRGEENGREETGGEETRGEESRMEETKGEKTRMEETGGDKNEEKEGRGAEEKEMNEREDKQWVEREESAKDTQLLEDKDVTADRVVVHFEDDIISSSTDREGPMPLHSLLRASSQEMLLHSTPAPHNNLTTSSDMELTIQTDQTPPQALPVSTARRRHCVVW